MDVAKVGVNGKVTPFQLYKAARPVEFYAISGIDQIISDDQVNGTIIKFHNVIRNTILQETTDFTIINDEEIEVNIPGCYYVLAVFQFDKPGGVNPNTFYLWVESSSDSGVSWDFVPDSTRFIEIRSDQYLPFSGAGSGVLEKGDRIRFKAGGLLAGKIETLAAPNGDTIPSARVLIVRTGSRVFDFVEI